METDAESFCCAKVDEIHASNVTLNNATLFQDIYSNKLRLRLIWLMFLCEYIL